MTAGKRIARPSAVISWLSSQISATDKAEGASHTFSGISIGADTPDRIIGIGFTTIGGGVGITGDQGLPTLGSNEPDDDPASAAAGDSSFALHYWTGLSGTTADLVVPIRTSTAFSIACHVFLITSAVSPVPRRAKHQFDAGPNASEAVTFDMDIGSVGFFFGKFTSSTPGMTFTNATERADSNPEANANYCAADHSATLKEVPRTVTFNWDSGATGQRVGGAIWR
jgi:hypothetical protein